MSRCLSTLVLLLGFSLPVSVAQNYNPEFPDTDSHTPGTGKITSYQDTLDNSASQTDSLPGPRAVMYKSMIIPGWGQIQNKQVWKVPVIYGLLGGITWYSIQLTKQYHDYRAAYYNLHEDTPDDMRFGPTPDYIPQNASLQALREARNTLRNRRDFTYIALGLAYGLNIVDAYVFAHMKSFDVSEDLSMNTSIKPSVLDDGSPGITLSIKLFTKRTAK